MNALTQLQNAQFFSAGRVSFSPITDPNPRSKQQSRLSFAFVPAASLSSSAFSADINKPVVVVGSANADIYLEIDRLPREGETTAARNGETLAGGKGANQACCGGRLAHPTYFVGQIGDDAHGRLIEDALRVGGVRVDRLARVIAVPTGFAVVMLQPDGQNSIIIVGGANMGGWPEEVCREDLEVVSSAGVVLLQREIPDRINIQVAEAAKNADVPVILDAGGVEGPIPDELLRVVDILSPNESELARLTGMPTETFEQISQAVMKCHEMGNSPGPSPFGTQPRLQTPWRDYLRRSGAQAPLFFHRFCNGQGSNLGPPIPGPQVCLPPPLTQRWPVAKSYTCY